MKGIIFIDPKREEGKAKFPSIQDITLQTLRETSEGKLRGKKVIITAGGTYEEIDSVRGITNRSSGKMGLEIAKEAFIQGADVTSDHWINIKSMFQKFLTVLKLILPRK